MEIRKWLCYIFIKCIIVQYLSAKTVSLNELIEAEEREAGITEKIRPSQLVDPEIKSTAANAISAADSKSRKSPRKLTGRKLTGLLRRLPLFKRLASNTKIRKLREDRDKIARTLLGGEKISPIKYRKAFQIKSPLKPRKLKLAQKSRRKRKNQSTKREVYGNEQLKKKHIPLLKNFGLLFDDLLDSDASNSNKVKTKTYKRNRFHSASAIRENNSGESSSGITDSRPQEETTVTSQSFSTKISSDTQNFSSSKDNDYSAFGSDKSVPILLPRNSASRRRDNNGSSTRSRTTYNRNIERNITRNHGTHEYDTGFGKNETYAKSNENDTNSITRNDASSIGYPRRGKGRTRDRNNSNNSTKGTAEFISKTKDENAEDSPRKNQLKVGGNKAENEKHIQQPVRRLRGSIPIEKIIHDERVVPETTQHERIHEEVILSTANNSPNYKQFTDKDGSNTPEDEKFRSRNETVILIETNYPRTKNYSESIDKKTPALLIFDGYSVTRDKNGKNKVSGKTLHIQS